VATEAEISAARLKMHLTAAAYAKMVDEDEIQNERAADELERRQVIAEAAWREYRRLIAE
jgi:hypothetical protein